jgi:predicted Zn finger-like uncharacterized protein
MVSDSLTDRRYRRPPKPFCLDSPMLIVCPNCATSYRVEPSSLGTAGRSVRCVRCRNVWFAHDPSALAAPEVEAQPTAGGGDTGTPDASWPASPDDPAGHGFAAEPAPAEAAAEPAAAQPPPEPAAWADQDPSLAIADAPALAPMTQDWSLPADAKLGEDIETVAARRAARDRRRSHWPLRGLPIAILALLALDAALIAWRADVVKVAPQTASLYAAIGLPVNLRGLSFADVTTTTETHDGVQVLVVEGTIASASARVVEIPRLRFSVRNPGGQEVYAWTALPSRSLLAPGETLAFRSRLASPPTDARDVLVRFFNRRDLVAGVQ